MSFHGCFNYAELPVNLSLVEILNAPVPDDPAVMSAFDQWIHESVFPMAQILESNSETFNII
jgi:hypothetical protein